MTQVKLFVLLLLSFTPKHYIYMDDFLLTLNVSFVDTDSGEVLATAQFSKPLSMFTPDNYQKYFDSALRGIRQGRKIALYVLFTSDRNLPNVKQQTIFF